MVKVVYKFVISLQESLAITVPKDRKWLSAQNQNGKICVWALVDPNSEKESTEIWVFGTGSKLRFPEEQHYIGTVQLDEFVWHVFERVRQ